MAGGRLRPRARGAPTTGSTWSYDAAWTRGTSPTPPACARSRWWSTARSCSTTAGPTRVDADEIRAQAAEQARPGCFARMEDALTALIVEDAPCSRLYLQDAHPIRDGMGYAQRTPRQRGFEAVWQAESRLVREATVPMAAFAAVTERDQGRLGRASTTGPATPPSSPRPSPRSTTSRPAGCILGIGAWWDPLAAKVGVDRRQAAAGDARDRRPPCGPCWPTRPSPSTASSCTSTASSSTTCTRSAGRRTCRSTSGPPA